MLKIEGLKTYFYTYKGLIKAVDGVDLEIGKGEIFGLVGESGCGKSTVALSTIRLVSWPPGKIVDGRILFEGEDLLQKTDEEIRRIRGSKISMIFQEPTTSLNPVLTIGDQIAEAIVLHQNADKDTAKRKTLEMLNKVRIADPKRVFRQYPHELSGGMMQRAMIAIALSCNPRLLIADEPTTSLDVTIGFEILQLIKELVNSIGASVMLITHDLGIVAEICDKVAVMYAGHVVEKSDVKRLFENPRHPYTKGLLASLPSRSGLLEEKKSLLHVIRGSVPDLINPPQGCRFHPRCESVKEACTKGKPRLLEVERGHYIACHMQ